LGVSTVHRGPEVLVIDGSRFDDFTGFAREFTRLLDDYEWRGNLNAFNDILRGGFGTPEGVWILRWLNSERSKSMLGHEARAQQLEELGPNVHPTNKVEFHEELAMARRHEGPTLFDLIVEIIRTHGPGGSEAEDGVVLELA
jgi:hypothetical protein